MNIFTIEEENKIVDMYQHNISVDDIKSYISTKDPLDKAGAYGIQNPYINLVKNLDGEYENVVGLPLIRLKKELEKLRT